MKASIKILASKKFDDEPFENPLKDLFDFIDGKLIHSVEFVSHQDSGNRVNITFTDGDKVYLNNLRLDQIDPIQML